MKVRFLVVSAGQSVSQFSISLLSSTLNVNSGLSGLGFMMGLFISPLLVTPANNLTFLQALAAQFWSENNLDTHTGGQSVKDQLESGSLTEIGGQDGGQDVQDRHDPSELEAGAGSVTELQSEGEEAPRLAERVKVLCWIMTQPQTHQSKVRD